MKKITIIGFFAHNTDYNGGQENKTRAISSLLKENYGEANIIEIDTLNWKKNPIKLFFKVIRAMKESDSVIMLPAQNGVKIFSRLLLMFKTKGKNIFYSVIGGWLPELTIKNKALSNILKKFDGIWVETKTMNNDLLNQGFTNVSVVPNFKKLKKVDLKSLSLSQEHPLKLCTFSRVLKEKGIEDAINVVNEINNELGKIVYSLHIYGKIDANYINEFEKLQEKFPDNIRYCGVVEVNESVETLKNYFALLFPTHFYTEGIPGTIVDAYASALPVISSKWLSFDDIIEDNVTGIGYEFGNYNELKQKLIEISKEPRIILNMKANCLTEYQKYTEEAAFEIIQKCIN